MTSLKRRRYRLCRRFRRYPRSHRWRRHSLRQHLSSPRQRLSSPRQRLRSSPRPHPPRFRQPLRSPHQRPNSLPHSLHSPRRSLRSFRRRGFRRSPRVPLRRLHSRELLPHVHRLRWRPQSRRSFPRCRNLAGWRARIERVKKPRASAPNSWSLSLAPLGRIVPTLGSVKQATDFGGAGSPQARARSDFAGVAIRRTSMRSARRALARATEN
jgi:hypothetical protein